MSTNYPAATALGLETVSGETIGRDPRAMDAPDLAALGHISSSVLEAVRAKCIDCCGGSVSEARKCVAVSCTLWPFRMGSNPLVRRTLTEEQKQVLRDRAATARANRMADAA
jgi:hypothetical protein